MGYNHENIIGQSEEINYVLYKVEQIAGSDTAVLVLGEAGTGKRVIARAVHSLRLRRDRAFPVAAGHPHGVTDAKNVAIYDHWSYMTMFLHPFISPQLLILHKEYA